MGKYNKVFMQEAIRLSLMNARKGEGPFGAVIVRKGRIIAKGVNRVTATNDPTAHAEIVAIRNASVRLKSFDLSGCELYTSCEPCPMCLSAIYWSDISRIYFGNTRKDAENIGFKDKHIYDEIRSSLPRREIPISRHMQNEALEAFEVWDLSPLKKPYGMLK